VPESTPLTADQRKLKKLVQERRDVDERIRTAVAAARRRGDTWASIAAVLGVTQQAANARFGKSR
jgi:hypothetical protein